MLLWTISENLGVYLIIQNLCKKISTLDFFRILSPEYKIVILKRKLTSFLRKGNEARIKFSNNV